MGFQTEVENLRRNLSSILKGRLKSIESKIVELNDPLILEEIDDRTSIDLVALNTKTLEYHFKSDYGDDNWTGGLEFLSVFQLAYLIDQIDEEKITLMGEDEYEEEQ